MKSENVFTLIRLPHSKLPNVKKFEHFVYGFICFTKN